MFWNYSRLKTVPETVKAQDFALKLVNYETFYFKTKRLKLPISYFSFSKVLHIITEYRLAPSLISQKFIAANQNMRSEKLAEI